MGRLEILKKLCKEKGITINKLEQELEFSQGSLGKIDSNMPKADKLYALAKYFGVPMETFFENDNISKETVQTISEDSLAPRSDLVIKLLEDKELYLLIERIINSSDKEREKFVQMGKLMGLL